MHTIWWAVWHTGWTGALCIISISWGNSLQGGTRAALARLLLAREALHQHRNDSANHAAHRPRHPKPHGGRANRVEI